MPNNEHLLCGVVYLPPCGSKYAHPDPYLELQTEYDRYCSDIKNVLLFGDFNSRTASLRDFIISDNFICEFNGTEELYSENADILQCFETCNIPLGRNNSDRKTNAYGYHMTEFYKSNNIFILNGRFSQNSSNLTCKNSSTVDYFYQVHIILNFFPDF